MSKLREFAYMQPCALRLTNICNRDPETTVLAHVSLFGSAGKGIKAVDLCGVHACSACHAALDGRGDEPPDWPSERHSDILRALLETLRRVSAHPKSVLPR